MKIVVEAPLKKNHIVQCTRCQSYGHNQTYCSRPYVCVKCGAEHNTTLCTKAQLLQPRAHYAAETTQRVTKDVWYTKFYNKYGAKSITQLIHPLIRLPLHQSISMTPVNSPLPRTPLDPATEHSPTSYSRIVTHHQHPTNMAEQLSIFLNEFKAMFNQLIQQNSMILNMLSTVKHKFTN